MNKVESSRTRLRGRDVAISTLGNVTLLMSAVVQAPLLAQALGLEQRGLLAGAIAPLMLLIGVATLGIPEASTYYIAKRSDAPRRIIVRGAGIIVIVGLAASLVVIVFALPFSNENEQLAQLIKMAVLALPLALITAVLRAAAAGMRAWVLVAIERAIFGTVRLGGFSALLLLGHLNLHSATIVMATSTFIGSLAYLGLLGRTGTTDPDRYHKASLIRYGSKFWLGSITGMLLTRLDQVLMVPLSSPAQLGLYAVAVSIAEIPLVISMSVRDVTFAVESESSSQNRVTAAARITTLAVFAMAVVIIAAAFPLVPILFGEEFVDSIPAIIIVLAGMVIVTGGSIGGMAIAARGHPGLRSLALALAAIVNASFLVALLPEFGAVGAAIATVAGNLVYAVIAVAISSRVLGTRVRDYLGLRKSDLVIARQMLSALRRRLWRATGHR